MEFDYDVAVIGSGPGGYVAAIRAAQLKARVLLIEKEKLGGVCLNRGCIPTKTLLKSAEKWREIQRCDEFGIHAENVGFDYASVSGRVNRVVEQMQRGIKQLVNGHAIDFKVGTAVLLGPNQLKVAASTGEESCTARSLILATGSVPMGLPVPGGDLPRVINSNDLLAMTSVPKSLVIVGAGVVGIEFAVILQAFGCEVTVIEALPTVLPMFDPEITRRMSLLLRKQGIKMMTSTRITGIREGHGGLTVQATDSKGEHEITAEKLMVAIGRTPVVSGLGLESAGIDYGPKGIAVNDRMETNVRGIYAIGDATGNLMLAHVASTEGMSAAENAMGGDTRMDYKAVPACVFTLPELAMVGLTEPEAIAKGIDIKISKFNFAANGKAVSMGETDGLVKIIADKADGRVVGMHILGAHASDLIMEGALAIRNGLSARDIANTIHPHPSLSETIMECAHGVEGNAIHQLNANRL